MCVIAYVETIRPTDDQINQMFDQNPRGGGVAWRELGTDGRPKVRWRKGLDRQAMLDLNTTLPMPYVLHFRVPSHGTSGSMFACHPFVVNMEATTDLEGETDGYVLFHNGLWQGWKEKMQAISIQGYVRVPSGPWSDSRGLAWAASHLGIGYLELVDEKVIVFGAEQYSEETFGKWDEVTMKAEDGSEKTLLVSNTIWERKPVIHHQGRVLDLAQRAITPAISGVMPGDEKSGGTSQPTTFRTNGAGSADPAGQRHAQQESIQETTEALGYPDVQTVKCSACAKSTSAGCSVGGSWLCWQCWGSKKDVLPMMGECETCKVNRSAARTEAGDEWMCKSCWDVLGRPPVYYSHARHAEGLVH